MAQQGPISWGIALEVGIDLRSAAQSRDRWVELIVQQFQSKQPASSSLDEQRHPICLLSGDHDFHQYTVRRLTLEQFNEHATILTRCFEDQAGCSDWWPRAPGYDVSRRMDIRPSPWYSRLQH